MAATSTGSSTMAPFLLPDGRLMDSKNTLQSFDAAAAAQQRHYQNRTPSSIIPDGQIIDGENTVPTKPNLFELPDGRPIDAKNTLQSFDGATPVVVGDIHRNNTLLLQPAAFTIPNEQIIDGENTLQSFDTTPLAERQVIHAEAVVVVDADISDSRIVEPSHPLSKRRNRCWLALLVIIGLLAVGIGTYCGTGNCIIPPQNTSPGSTFDDPLYEACFFLNAPFFECQDLTSFRRNSVGGTIPTEIGRLTQIIELDLFNNQLIGSIPSSLGNFTQLTYLDLANNQLTGTLPSSLGYLTQLTYLGLEGNQFTGTIPSTFGNLTQLVTLGLNNNTQLSGTIPSSLCTISFTGVFIDCANIACLCCFDGIDLNNCPTST